MDLIRRESMELGNTKQHTDMSAQSLQMPIEVDTHGKIKLSNKDIY